MTECPACEFMNSESAEYKCRECQTPLITKEEAEAMFPPGRGGYEWFDRYDEDRNKRDLAIDYVDEVHKGTWSPDPTLHGREGYITPEGIWWPCGWQQHKYIAPVLVAYFDLYGEPEITFDKTGGCVTTGEDGIQYYEMRPHYPDSQDILKANGYIKVTPGLDLGSSCMFGLGYKNEHVTDAQHETIATWREKNDIGEIEFYDSGERWRKEHDNASND